ncbi:MAG TPA: adenosylcobinamide-phosphate synthase CbiB [Chloroflexota bacterium]|jgi:adenosylcobinamide-phosphate synthase
MLGNSWLVLIGALALERIIGDPVSRWHPVALFGRAIEVLVQRAPATGTRRQFVYGAVLTIIPVLAVGLGSAVVLRYLEAIEPWAGLLVGAALLKISLSYRQLEKEALRIADQVGAEQLDLARSSAQALVSRPTADLSEEGLVSAAVESLAENLSDSFVAPLFYFVLLGVPGALAYRAINTLDAMIGYHGRFEYLGKFAAKLDDLVNWAPARLTAYLLALGGWGFNPVAAWQIARRDHGRTESPNAGWPMAAMAGVLGVRLEKVGHYVLGDGDRRLTAERVKEAAGIARRGAFIAGALAFWASSW